MNHRECDDDISETYSYSNSDSEQESDSHSSGNGSYRSFDETSYRRRGTLVRRRGASPDHSLESSASDDSDQNHRGRGGRSRPRSFTECIKSHWPSLILMTSFLIWLNVHLTTSPVPPSSAIGDETLAVRNRLRSENKLTREEMVRLRKQREAEGKIALGSAATGVLNDAADSFLSFVGKSKRGRVEAIREGCQPSDWQSLSFPTCNEIHEIDLLEELHVRTRNRTLDNLDSPQAQEEAMTNMGFVGSGLWRTVWNVDPRGEATDGDSRNQMGPLVLKIMKGEHEFDARNFDRHRRDALTMERLTASPNVVSIYGFCGNTVLTEYIGQDLDAVIDANGEDTEPTRKTPLGRLRLALNVARGVAAIHEISGGPIIHADIQSQQFLVDSRGIVKLNDFNRCRFMPHNIMNGNPCPIRIPTAPGGSRAPEEYNNDELTDKADVYSTAHVLFEILTGQKAWSEYSGSQIKRIVTSGGRPSIDRKYLTPGSADAGLAALIDLSYELDPKDRLNATELVVEIERLIAVQEAHMADNATKD